jgi:hypothetical protein
VSTVTYPPPSKGTGRWNGSGGSGSPGPNIGGSAGKGPSPVGATTDVRGLPPTGPQLAGGVQGGGDTPPPPTGVAGEGRAVLPSALPRTGAGGADTARQVPWAQAGLALALLLPGAGRVLATATRLRRLHTTVRRLVGEEATPQPGRNRRTGPP